MKRRRDSTSGSNRVPKNKTQQDKKKKTLTKAIVLIEEDPKCERDLLDVLRNGPALEFLHTLHKTVLARNQKPCYFDGIVIEIFLNNCSFDSLNELLWVSKFFYVEVKRFFIDLPLSTLFHQISGHRLFDVRNISIGYYGASLLRINDAVIIDDYQKHRIYYRSMLEIYSKDYTKEELIKEKKNYWLVWRLLNKFENVFTQSETAMANLFNASFDYHNLQKSCDSNALSEITFTKHGTKHQRFDGVQKVAYSDGNCFDCYCKSFLLNANNDNAIGIVSRESINIDIFYSVQELFTDIEFSIFYHFLKSIGLFTDNQAYTTADVYYADSTELMFSTFMDYPIIVENEIVWEYTDKKAIRRKVFCDIQLDVVRIPKFALGDEEFWLDSS